MSDFQIKRGDTSPAVQITCTDEAGAAVNLSAASVRFHMAADGGAVVVDRAAVIVTPADGTVRYDWQAGDTAPAGRFLAEFEVTYSDGAIETFPNAGALIVRIDPDLA